MNEKSLILEAQKGDHKAFLTLLERYDRKFMAVAYRFTCDLYDREDLYQDIVLHLFHSLPSYGFRSSFSTWLHRVALNRCLTYVKARPLTMPEVEPAGPPQDWERREKLRAVYRALSRLKGKQRICFFLHYVEDWPIAEIGSLLRVDEGTIKSHLNRARAKIKNDREVRQWQNNPI